MLNDAEFAIVARETKQRSGAVLTREMAGAAEVRLTPLSRREGFGSVTEMLSAARTRADGKLWAGIADALAQTDTRFFRDRAMFKRLADEILPRKFLSRGHERVRIWAAACGTGQEAYSIAMTLAELRKSGANLACEIVATDMSQRLIDKARSGLYTQFEVQRGLPIRSLIEHFERAGDLWRIADRLRAGVRFETHNLLQHPGQLGQFDIILLCNVIGSFDEATRIATLDRIADAMHPDAVLIMGAGEHLPPGADGFAVEDGLLVRKKTSARRAA
jgi:chemotaxis protein methyltransferase CheR